jgi:hypothetical protein
MSGANVEQTHITKDDFAARFPHLVHGRHLLPTKQVELQMLLLSTVLNLGSGTTYSESQINEELRRWISRFGTNLTIDHVTLRRYLVDETILQRDQFGSSYSLSSRFAFFTFDASIRDLDLDKLVAQFQEDRAARKSAYLAARDEHG